MLTASTIKCIDERTDPREVDANRGALTIRCYLYPLVTISSRPYLKPDRNLAYEAMTLLLHLDRN